MKNTKKVQWAEKEIGGGKFRDQRLSKRMIQIAEDFSNSPTFPINQASEDAASTKAAYRFFSNPKVKDEKILEPHIEQTLKRMESYPIVLAVQDTTSLNYHSHESTEGLGEISKTGNTSVQGLFMHSVECLTPQGTPLGFIDQIIWARLKKKEELVKKEKKSQVIEEKESMKWLECLRNTAELTKSHPSTIVTVCDREADIYEFFLEAKKLKQEVLVRCFHDREINDDGIPIWEYVNQLSVAGKTEVELKKTQKRGARRAQVNIKYGKIEIHPPEKSRDTHILSLSIVYAKEVGILKDKEALEWLLVTTLPIDDFKSALEKISWYRVRWSIEIFHKLMKSGLKVEECRLDEGIKLSRYLTLMTVVAWRILWMTYVQRVSPAASATTVLSATELKVLYYVTHKKKMTNEKISLRDAIHWIARKGGFLDRKGDGEPGMITLWRGWNRLIDMVQGFELFSNP